MTQLSANIPAYPRLTQPFAASVTDAERQRFLVAVEETANTLGALYGSEAVDWFDADLEDVITDLQASAGGLFVRLGAACVGLTNSALFGLLQDKLGGQFAAVRNRETPTRVDRAVCFRNDAGDVTGLAAATFPRYDASGQLTGSRTMIALLPRQSDDLHWTTPAPQSLRPARTIPTSSEPTRPVDAAMAPAAEHLPSIPDVAAADMRGRMQHDHLTPQPPDLPDTLCAVPWLNLSLDVDGSVRPCCKFAHLQGDDAAAYGNLKTHNLTEVWHSPGMVRLREEFRAGGRPQPCQTCWNEEAAGVRSYRQSFEAGRIREAAVDFDDFRPARPVTLDLKLSNRCNLKCRICGPLASSLFLSETLRNQNDNPGYLTYLEQEKSYLLSNKITQHQSNREIFKQWLPEIQHLELFGGETTISEEVRELEELVIAEGRAPHVSLLFNTNITVFSPEAIERWRKFRRVTICLSLDDIGRRFEYQRHPAKWEKVRDNVQKYAAVNEPNFSICVFCSVSSYNILYLPEIAAWWRENCPHIGFVLNYVHYDPFYCVRHMPESVKTVVRERLTAAAAEIHVWESKFRGRNTNHPRAAGQLQEAIAFLDQGAAEPEQWQAFLRRTSEYDRLRAETFAEVFPELWSMIEADPASLAGAPNA